LSHQGARQPLSNERSSWSPLWIDVRVNRQSRPASTLGSVSTERAVTSEWRVLERIAELRAQGHSLREIATVLKVEGHLPKRGGSWHPETLRRAAARAARTSVPVG